MTKKVSFVILTAVVITFFPANAQNIPALKDIVEKVKTNTIPTKSYAVEITQTLEAPEATSIGKSLTSGTMLKQNSFRTLYTPNKGLAVDMTAQANQSSSASAPQQQKDQEAGNVKVTVDLSKVFESIDEWQHVNIAEDILNGRTCYVITGNDGMLDFKIWVDAANSYASRLIVNLQGKEFSATDISYERVDGQFWLPSKIDIRHAMDGSHVTQQFGRYQFQ